MNPLNTNGQTPSHPCDNDAVDLLLGTDPDKISFSSIDTQYENDLAGLISAQGEAGYFQSLPEAEPWIEIDLGKNTHLDNFAIWYPQEQYPLHDYFFLTSDLPFRKDGLEAHLAAEEIKKFHVLSSSPSGTSFSLENFKGRYIRIQRSGYGILAISGIDVPGYGENCFNGEDDDCDGDIDCADSDCAAQIYNIEIIPPSCPICSDGEIRVQANQGDLEYSLDGGNTFVPFTPLSPNSSLHLFDNLPEGEYSIVVRNEVCGASPPQSVSVLAPQGGSHGSCFNGGFEEGTFEGWELGLSENENGARPPSNSILSGPGSRHQIIQGAGAFDEEAGFPLTPPTEDGIYIAKLNRPATPAQKLGASMFYDFTVEATSPELNFFYAVVLEDGNEHEPHSPSEQPFFYWRVIDANAVQINCPGCEGYIVADVQNEFFQNTGFLVYKEWTCHSMNLTNFIGQNLTIEFYVVGCSKDGHWAYAYIDGLCTENTNPVVDFKLNEVYCQNQVVTAEVTKSLGTNRHYWEVCRTLEDGNPTNQCYLTDLAIAPRASSFEDILGFFFDPNAHNAGELNCGDIFNVKLVAINDCGTTIVEKKFTYICEEASVSYPDIAVCGNLQDVQIQGESDCLNCTFDWSPGQYLNSSTVLNPIILGSINIHALKQVYQVEMTTPAGCVYEEEVNIFETQEIFGDIELEIISLNRCEQEFVVHIQLEEPVHSDDLSVVFSLSGMANNELYDSPPGIQLIYNDKHFPGNLISEPGLSDIHSYQLPEVLLKRYNYDLKVRVSLGDLPENMVIAGGVDCILNESFEIPSGKYHGVINVFMPNGFSPNGDGANDTYGPFFHATESNVFAAGMRIFNQWGGMLFEGIYEAPDGETVLGTEPEIRWDGNVYSANPDNWEPAPVDVYVWVIDYANCDFGFEGCLGCDVWDIDGGSCGNCSDRDYYGDLTLVR
ncbi:MAG: gliding motility-associated C-terminal domain-containing protein [Phaeodactylibacter sp.]|nr:gliding motility-associated C-terminal domain-containing protein [Phaeodactylibacter sp.]